MKVYVLSNADKLTSYAIQCIFTYSFTLRDAALIKLLGFFHFPES